MVSLGCWRRYLGSGNCWGGAEKEGLGVPWLILLFSLQGRATGVDAVKSKGEPIPGLEKDGVQDPNLIGGRLSRVVDRERIWNYGQTTNLESGI